MNVSSKIETSVLSMEIKNNIIYCVLKEDADVDLEAIKEAIEARKKLQANKPMLALVDNRKMWQLTKEASDYSASREVAELSRAMAILSDRSLGKRLMVNFFMKMNKQHVPTKMFKSEAKAIKWLNTFKD